MSEISIPPEVASHSDIDPRACTCHSEDAIIPCVMRHGSLHCRSAAYDIAMAHLGEVLYLLADLVPEERCRALDNALKFYNDNRPDAAIEPTGIWKTYLINRHPVLDAEK